MTTLPVLIARLGDRAAAIVFVKAALKRAVAIVPLDAAPEHEGFHLLLLHAPGLDEPVLLAAVPVGDPAAGMYPLRLGPRDDFGEGALLALLASQGALPLPPPPRTPSVRPPPVEAIGPRTRSTWPPPSPPAADLVAPRPRSTRRRLSSERSRAPSRGRRARGRAPLRRRPG